MRKEKICKTNAEYRLRQALTKILVGLLLLIAFVLFSCAALLVMGGICALFYKAPPVVLFLISAGIGLTTTVIFANKTTLL